MRPGRIAVIQLKINELEARKREVKLEARDIVKTFAAIEKHYGLSDPISLPYMRQLFVRGQFPRTSNYKKSWVLAKLDFSVHKTSAATLGISTRRRGHPLPQRFQVAPHEGRVFIVGTLRSIYICCCDQIQIVRFSAGYHSQAKPEPCRGRSRSPVSRQQIGFLLDIPEAKPGLRVKHIKLFDSVLNYLYYR